MTLTPITQIDNETQVRQTQEAFWACGGCHERESGQEKVVRHQLCKARMWEQSPREKGGARPARARESEREGAQDPSERRRKWGHEAHARERARGGARPMRERVGSEPTLPHQKGQCDREKAVKEWAPPECSGIGWLTKRDNETRMTDKNCGVVWEGGKRSSTKESCAHHKRFQRKLMLQSLECMYYRSQRPTVALAACQCGKCSVCSLTIVCSLTALAACQRGKCSACSLTIVCSLKLSF